MLNVGSDQTSKMSKYVRLRLSLAEWAGALRRDCRIPPPSVESGDYKELVLLLPLIVLISLASCGFLVLPFMVSGSFMLPRLLTFKTSIFKFFLMLIKLNQKCGLFRIYKLHEYLTRQY